MKKLILILSLISTITQAQNAISVSVLHDVKLGLGIDKAHKNDTPTLDVIFNLTLEGNQFEYYYFAIQAQYEHANLYDGQYTRYSVNSMWYLNRLVVPKLEFAYGFGLGMINRPQNEGNGSYSGTIELSYEIFKNLDLVNKNEWVRRSDLATPKMGYNLSLGLKYQM